VELSVGVEEETKVTAAVAGTAASVAHTASAVGSRSPKHQRMFECCFMCRW
jgi:hypothetical protein